MSAPPAALLVLVFLLQDAPAPGAVGAPPQASPASLELVETAPVETRLDHPEMRETYEAWLELVAGARETLDLAQFFASENPNGESRLTPIVDAIEAAAARGVAVRFLGDASFQESYPDALDRLDAREGVEVRLLSLPEGAQHAKYIVADGRAAYVGSANFDWRSLEHAVELGLLARVPAVAQALGRVFEMDWCAAGGETVEPTNGWEELFPADVGGARVTLLASPLDRLPAPDSWDLPRLVAAIDAAQEEVAVQVLTYRASSSDGTWFGELENALRRAAARGVSVKLLVSDWCKIAGTIEGLQSLQCLPSVEVRLVEIPAWSGGFVPYARVARAKSMVVDRKVAWIGTSNWCGDDFLYSRNVGLLVEGGDVPESARRFFEDLWTSPYAATVDPCATYEAPRIGG